MLRYGTLFPAIKARCISSLPIHWKELEAIFSQVTARTLPFDAHLPIAATVAAGGKALAAIDIAAAVTLSAIGLRIEDDAIDMDKERGLVATIGPGRAFLLANGFKNAALQLISNSPALCHCRQAMLALFLETFQTILEGQELDTRFASTDIEDYWDLVEHKSASAYAAAVVSGGILANGEPLILKALTDWGTHLGFAKQILNDLESLRNSPFQGDLANNKLPLPLIYGLHVAHEDRARLAEIVEKKEIYLHVTEVKAILEKIGARKFMVWAALEKRRLAEEIMKSLPQNEGTLALTHHFDSMFGDIDSLLQEKNAPVPPTSA